MKREERDFDRESDKESEEEKRFRAPRQNESASLEGILDRGQVESAGGVVEPNDADEHQDRASHRVEDEFDGGVNAAVVAPDADEQVHRDEHHFPEEEEEEKVEREEDAYDADFQKQDGDEKFFDALLDAAPRTEDGDDGKERRQDDEEHADAVHAEVIVDVGLRKRLLRRDAMRAYSNPTMKFFELVACAAERDAAEEPPQRQNKFGERDGKREAANPFLVVAAKKQQRKGADGGQENQNREQRSGWALAHHPDDWRSRRPEEDDGDNQERADDNPDGVTSRVAGLRVADYIADVFRAAGDAVNRAVDAGDVDDISKARSSKST